MARGPEFEGEVMGQGGSEEAFEICRHLCPESMLDGWLPGYLDTKLGLAGNVWTSELVGEVVAMRRQGISMNTTETGWVVCCQKI